jgi:FimV-like protein
VWDLRKEKHDTPLGIQHLIRSFTLVTFIFLGCAWVSSWAATDSYTTQPGDTLWDIATRYIADDTVSPQQMMLALFRANPGAFIDTNINRLKMGAVLRIPAREETLATRFEDAVTEVAQQNALWHGDRARLAGTTPVGLGQTATASPHVATDNPTSLTPPETRGKSVAVASPEQPLTTSAAPSERGATETLADNEVLRTRIATLEERLAKLDGVITVQHGQLAKLQQHLAGSQEYTSTQTAAGREDVASAVPSGEAPPAVGTASPTIVEKPKVGSRSAVWVADPKIVMVVGGIALLGLAVMWLRVRHMTAHKATAEMAPTATVQTLAAPLARVENDAFMLDSSDLDVGGKVVSETTLADLMLDVDDLDLEGDQGREEGTGDGTALPRLPNTASSSRKAGEASP